MSEAAPAALLYRLGQQLAELLQPFQAVDWLGVPESCRPSLRMTLRE